MDPTTLAGALKYGELGLAFVVIVLVFYWGGKVLMKFVDQVLSQAGQMADVAKSAVAANVETVEVLRQIGSHLEKHDQNTSVAHAFITDDLKTKNTKLDTIKERIGDVVK